MADNAVTGPPIWLLDVDGVINRIGVRMPGPELRTFKSANGYQITYEVDLLERMAKLHADGKIEIQWLTTWEELADAYLAEELGLPRGLTVAGQYATADANFRWWKHGTARQLFDLGHRIIWTDDDLNFEPSARNWAVSAEGPQLIWFAPDERIGITHEFIDRVEAWL